MANSTASHHRGPERRLHQVRPFPGQLEPPRCRMQPKAGRLGVGESLPGGDRSTLQDPVCVQGCLGVCMLVPAEQLCHYSLFLSLSDSTAFQSPKVGLLAARGVGFKVHGNAAWGICRTTLVMGKQRLPWKPFIPSQTCSLVFLP